MKTTNKTVALLAVVVAIVCIVGTAVVINNLEVPGEGISSGEVEVYVTEGQHTMSTTGMVSVYIVNPAETE